jgi:hypothetical protein
MIPHVETVMALAGNKLFLHFDTGEDKIFDLSPYMGRLQFLPLADVKLFGQARVAFGTVEWPNGTDLDPEDLYYLSVPAPGSCARVDGFQTLD